MKKLTSWFSTGDWHLEQPSSGRQTVNIHQEQDEPIFTGLYDHRGIRLYCKNEKQRIGFKWSV
jgi:hypothetical protein